MKSSEKILIGVVAVAAVAGIAYLAMQPKRPTVVYIPPGQSSTASSIQQGALAASELAPVAENLFNNIFGQSNSGAASGSDIESLPSSYNSSNTSTQASSELMSGIPEMYAGGVM
jgi:hypothetical protein